MALFFVPFMKPVPDVEGLPPLSKIERLFSPFLTGTVLVSPWTEEIIPQVGVRGGRTCPFLVERRSFHFPGHGLTPPSLCRSFFP